MAETNNAYLSLREANAVRQREWDQEGGVTLSYRGNELAGETGEACNVLKKLERERVGIRGSRETVAHLAEELADVVICVDLIALAVGIDLDAAVVSKFNATSEKYGLRTRLAAHRRPLSPRQGKHGCAFCDFGAESGLPDHAEYCDVSMQRRELETRA